MRDDTKADKINISEISAANSRYEKVLEKKEREMDKLHYSIKIITNEKLDAVNEKTVAKNAVSALTREIEWLQKATVQELSNIDGLVRDRDKMIKDIEKVESDNQANKMEIKLLENEKKTIKE